MDDEATSAEVILLCGNEGGHGTSVWDKQVFQRLLSGRCRPCRRVAPSKRAGNMEGRKCVIRNHRQGILCIDEGYFWCNILVGILILGKRGGGGVKTGKKQHTRSLEVSCPRNGGGLYGP